MRRRTHEEFIKEIKEKYDGDYTILEKYVDARTKVLVMHNCDKCDNYKWEVIPSNLLKGHGCPKCAGTIKKTRDEFINEVKDKYGNEYRILGEYVNTDTKIEVRHNCKKCSNYEWETKPSHLLNGHGCPVCAGKKTILGINTIWDIDRWMCDLGVSEEDAKKYASQSKCKIRVICPDCGKEKKMKISNIYNRRSIGCSCGDGKSYPEKFIMNLMEQLEADFETEYSPKWIESKRYDFYIKDLNCIIETHGGQHYDGRFNKLGGRTLEEEQRNDRFKEETALVNGIKYYIKLDCRESNMRYIKNSIINSELYKLLDLSKISWTSCAEFANKNIVKEVCNYWSNKKEDETTANLVKIFKLDKSIIIDYLKKGAKLDWCNYDPKEERKKSGLKASKKVMILKNGKPLGAFESCSELARQSEKLFGIKLLNTGISSVCTGGQKYYKGYKFKYI